MGGGGAGPPVRGARRGRVAAPLPALRHRRRHQPHAGLRRADRDAGRDIPGERPLPAGRAGRCHWRLRPGGRSLHARRRRPVPPGTSPHPTGRRSPLLPPQVRRPAHGRGAVRASARPGRPPHARSGAPRGRPRDAAADARVAVAAGGRAMTGRRRDSAVWLVVVVTAALMAFGIAVALATPYRASDGSGAWGAIYFVVPVAAFSIVGALIALRRPGNAIPWLLGPIGLLFAIALPCSAVAKWGLEADALPQPVAEWVGVGSSVWVIALGLLGTQLPLRLPDGRLPSPRWRWFSRISLALIAITLIGMAAQRGRVEDVPGTANPLGSAWVELLSGAIFLLILCFFVGLAALVIRYRRADELDRAQLRWVALGGAVFLAIYIVTLPLPSTLGTSDDSTAANLITAVSQAAFGALPIAIGYAILRHRLYDIDVVVNRTLVYGALTATLAAAYLGCVLLLQLLLGGITGDSGLAVAGSTLAVAALFRPARARIQAAVDRRFFRRKYDAQRTLEAFSSRLRDEVDLRALNSELNAVVRETLQPAHLSLWLRAPEAKR